MHRVYECVMSVFEGVHKALFMPCMCENQNTQCSIARCMRECVWDALQCHSKIDDVQMCVLFSEHSNNVGARETMQNIQECKMQQNNNNSLKANM